jgi:hypothetical protein
MKLMKRRKSFGKDQATGNLQLRAIIVLCRNFLESENESHHTGRLRTGAKRLLSRKKGDSIQR